MFEPVAFTLIPARGGSKGIPKKNLIPLNGNPLIYHAITASINSNVKETWVSTDCPEIARISKEIGACVIMRPKLISQDHSPSEDALLHFAKENVNFDNLVFMQATCPFVIPEDINESLRLLTTFDSVISVSKCDQFFWEGAQPMYDINNRKRRQNREQVFIETGSIFTTKRSCLLSSKNRISGNIGFVEIPKWRAVDIDTYDDLMMAEVISKTI